MRSFFLRFSCIVLALATVVECQWGYSHRSKFNQTSSRQPSKGGYTYGNHGYYSSPEPMASAKTQPNKSVGGIGAWGYIAILLSVILSGMGIYYFIIFYPIVCKKERMYDVMEMTAV